MLQKNAEFLDDCGVMCAVFIHAALIIDRCPCPAFKGEVFGEIFAVGDDNVLEKFEEKKIEGGDVCGEGEDDDLVTV